MIPTSILPWPRYRKHHLSLGYVPSIKHQSSAVSHSSQMHFATYSLMTCPKILLWKEDVITQTTHRVRTSRIIHSCIYVNLLRCLRIIWINVTPINRILSLNHDYSKHKIFFFISITTTYVFRYHHWDQSPSIDNLRICPPIGWCSGRYPRPSDITVLMDGSSTHGSNPVYSKCLS